MPENEGLRMIAESNRAEPREAGNFCVGQKSRLRKELCAETKKAAKRG